MSPITRLTSTLETHPRLTSAIFTATILLSQAGAVAAGGNCGVITGP